MTQPGSPEDIDQRQRDQLDEMDRKAAERQREQESK